MSAFPGHEHATAVGHAFSAPCLPVDVLIVDGVRNCRHWRGGVEGRRWLCFGSAVTFAARFPCSPFLAARHQRDEAQGKQQQQQQQQQMSRARSYTHASLWQAGSGRRGERQYGGKFAGEVVGVGVDVVGRATTGRIGCDVRAMQDTADRRTARKQGLWSATLAGAATTQAARWAAGDSLDGLVWGLRSSRTFVVGPGSMQR